MGQSCDRLHSWRFEGIIWDSQATLSVLCDLTLVHKMVPIYSIIRRSILCTPIIRGCLTPVCEMVPTVGINKTFPYHSRTTHVVRLRYRNVLLTPTVYREKHHQ